ncbi:MAG: FeoA family protein [Smithella sp.]|nr:FeoA family protein [Smithella sp.]
MSPLALLKEGEMAEIVMCHEKHGQGRQHRHGHNHDQCGGKCDNCTGHDLLTGEVSDHLMHIGLRPGKQVEMITNKGTGPLVLRLEESRIALGRGMAMKIYVRRNKE